MPLTLGGRIALCSLAVAYTALCLAQPGVAVGTFCAVAVESVLSFLGHRREARIVADRPRESICTFARGFGREIDTWIVRALYEELQSWSRIPPRASDDLAEVYGIDDEDLHDLFDDVATRAGYVLGHAASFRLYGRVRTVEDVAILLNAQPLRRLGVAG